MGGGKRGTDPAEDERHHVLLWQQQQSGGETARGQMVQNE